MLSRTRKTHLRPCAFGTLSLVFVAALLLLLNQSAVGQGAQDGAAKGPAVTPADGGQDGAKVASTQKKPPAPRLKRPYGQLPQPTAEQEKEYGRKRSEIQRILRDGVIPADKQAEFDAYYKNYALARWTFNNRLHEVAKYRTALAAELAMSYKQNRSNNQAHDRLQALALQYLQGYVDPGVLATRNFSPVTRYNAILMIGELNQVEPSISNRTPTPLPEALTILQKRATDSRNIDAVRIGALIGIRRHCRLMKELKQNIPQDILGTLGSLAKQQESERVRSEDGQAWMRLIAIRTFGDLEGAPRPDIVSGILRGIVAEKDSPLFLRYEAAAALGTINYRNVTGIKPEDYLHTLGLVTIEVCDTERQRLRDEMESERTPTPSAYGGYGSEMGSEMGMEMESSSMGYEEMDMYGSGGMTGAASATSTASDRQIERVRRRLQEGMTAALIGMGRKSKNIREGEELALNMVIENRKIEDFSNPIHDFFKVIDAKDDKDQGIQAKALDDAIVEVRAKLADALSQVGPPAPESPEFEPIREMKQSPYGAGSSYDGEYGMAPGY